MNQGENRASFELPEQLNELEDVDCKAWHFVPELAGDKADAGPVDPGGTLILQPHRLLALEAER
jgi:glycogen operon protein